MPDTINYTTPGTWLVRTQGSEHVWDIQPDRVMYRRIPGKGRQSFPADEHFVRLTCIQRWPTIGDTFFVWFDDPQYPSLMDQWRRSSTIVSIESLDTGTVL